MDPKFIANVAMLMLIVLIGGAVAVFLGKISWGDVGLIFLGGLAVSIVNGVVISRRLRKIEELNSGG